MRLHVSYGFASLPDAELITFTEGVDTGLDGNPKYPTLPSNATLAMLAAALLAFSTSLPIAKHGGQMDTANKNALRNALIALLYLLAGYVQNACDQDLATLLSSGFKAASQEPGLVAERFQRRLAPPHLQRPARARGGSTGASEWSDPVTRRAP
jgi:hypothetical protein